MDQKERRQKTLKMLRDYKSSKAAIMTYQIDLQMLDTLMINANMAMAYDQPSSGPTNQHASKVEEELIKIEQQRAWITGQLARLQNQIDKVDLALGNIEPPYKTLLKLKYIEGRRWAEIYPRLNYSEEYIRTKINERALDMIADYLFPQACLMDTSGA